MRRLAPRNPRGAGERQREAVQPPTGEGRVSGARRPREDRRRGRESSRQGLHASEGSGRASTRGKPVGRRGVLAGRRGCGCQRPAGEGQEEEFKENNMRTT